jgi:pimeloyl-ACP methyl ester carboxylesterase
MKLPIDTIRQINSGMKNNLKLVKRMLMIIAGTIMGISLIIAILLLAYSPGKPIPFLDDNGKQLAGSISEKTFLTIGGVRQGMFIKGKSHENPVMLYLHGGIPDYFLSGRYPTGLEDHFTVVWWEQRGLGLSFNTNISPESMNLDQMIADTKELTNYLRTRFGQEKIYLMGRSGGSFIGIQAAVRAPELYHSYIGVGQMSDHVKSERLAYEYMVKKYMEAGNNKMVRKLEASPVTEVIPYAYLKLRDHAMHDLGIGTTHDMNSVIKGLFIPSLTCLEYTVGEKFNLWRSKSQSGVHPLWDEMINTDLTKQVNEVKIPVYFFHGIFDYTVSYPLAKKYLEELHAPLKGFYTFENSAHSPLFEEPMRVRQIFEKDVLNGSNDLADKE